MSYERWTSEEDVVLKSVYPHSSKADIQIKFPNKEWKSVRLRARHLGLHRDKELIDKDRIIRGPRKDAWRPEEENLLRQVYPIKSKQEILAVIDRPWAGIWSRAYAMGLTRDPEIVKQEMIEGGSKAPAREDFWSADENAYLKENFQAGDKKEILGRLNGRTWKAIKIHAQWLDMAPRNRKLIDKDRISELKRLTRERYGVDSTFQLPEVQAKIRRANQKRRGTDYPLQSPEVQEKVKQANQEHYGVDNVFQAEEIKQQIVKTNMKRYGVAYDTFQNATIPNLIRFWSDEAASAQAAGTIQEFITDKISGKSVCHQFLKKQEHLKEDLETLGFDHNKLTASMFELAPEPFSSEITQFIKKYEWLGTIGMAPKWCFTAHYHGRLAAVVLLNEPTAYSKILGDDTPKYEALIQRGASASWTPKNLGSRLVTFACRWMTQNTTKRAFIGYSDPEAGEIGTIYQACNFDYLGGTFGNRYVFRHPEIKNGRVFSAQNLKRTSTFKQWCYKNGVKVLKEWIKDNGFKDLSAIPSEVKKQWRGWIWKVIAESERILIDKKGKYVLVLGKDKREENLLKSLRTYKSFPYPKRQTDRLHPS